MPLLPLMFDCTLIMCGLDWLFVGPLVRGEEIHEVEPVWLLIVFLTSERMAQISRRYFYISARFGIMTAWAKQENLYLLPVR